jgi:NAD(P)-dependent dehydrogenase (short-subunit alcohol dehydrogenase family)
MDRDGGRGDGARRLTGKVAFITGGGRGIGGAIARGMAVEGARVFLVARTRSELERVAADVMAAGGVAAHVSVDVSDAAGVIRAAAACESALGPIDVLVNAAGIHGPIGPAWEADAGEWARAVEVNLLGTLHTCRAVIPGMIERGGGRIINLSGGGATAPFPRFSAYAATKAAVVRLTETLAAELSPHHVAVNALAPGAVDTTLQDGVLAAGERAGEEGHRVRRLRESGVGATPMDLPVALAIFLASDAAAGLSGKLVSAPHDDWAHWDTARIADLMASPWLTLRRMDAHTLRPIIQDLPGST